MDASMGKSAKDKITGFVGIITGRSEYINGCVHIMLEAKIKPGMKPVHAWFDEDRVVLTGRSNLRKKVERIRIVTAERTGGPMPHSM